MYFFKIKHVYHFIYCNYDSLNAKNNDIHYMHFGSFLIVWLLNQLHYKIRI
jgi:hypothetical protein